MFNKEDPPVSLFAFQDIITSLTGIMIFFLLLLSLNILELTQNREKQSPIYTDLKNIKKKNQLLKIQIDEIHNDIKNYRKNIKIAQVCDESTLIIERYSLEKKIRDINHLKKNTEEQIRECEESYYNKTLDNKHLKKQEKALQNDLNKCIVFEEKIRNNEKNISQIREKIKKRRKEIKITIDSSVKKIPILVECSINCICIFNTRTQKKYLIRRQSPIVVDFLFEALSYMQSLGDQNHYFVILSKPSFVNYIRFFIIEMNKKMKNVKYGIEPIRENEVFLNE